MAAAAVAAASLAEGPGAGGGAAPGVSETSLSVVGDEESTNASRGVAMPRAHKK
jgi:hypothetical protein